MIRLVAACSMQSGFNSVGVSCSAMLDVSSNGGKYGRMRYTLNTGCRPRNGGMLSLNFSHSLGNGVRTISEWFEFPIGSGKVFFCKCN